MAKTRAQRKAERRAREAQQRKQHGEAQPPNGQAERERLEESQAQHDTQVPVSGDVAEFEAAIETQSVPPEDPTALPPVGVDTVGQPVPQPPPPPAPSRADEPPAPPKKSRRELRAERKAQEQREKKQRESEERLRKDQPVAEERRRGVVIGFIASCWAELKRVQWPDRDTLVQASAVTLVFVAVMAAYLGALDGIFNLLIKRLI